ncbi:hypothetical protein F183_A00390 [Bryobacterales bacterium F-183]|nr:hypothetical protein F183_A00390 [Bryobacterales bacterium F-183]
MLHWICPECGRECEPVERDCPECYPDAAASLVAAGATSVLSQTASSAVVSIPQVLSAKTGIVLPPPLPPPLPVPSFLMPDPEPVVTAQQQQTEPQPQPEEPPTPVVEEPDPVPAGLTALSVSMAAAQTPVRRHPGATARLEPLFHVVDDPEVAGLPFESGVEPQPVSGIREPATLTVPAFPKHRPFHAAPPVSGANALAFDAFPYPELDAQQEPQPAGFASRTSGLELAPDPALLEVLEREAVTSRSLERFEETGELAHLVSAPVQFGPAVRPAPAPVLSHQPPLYAIPEAPPLNAVAQLRLTAVIAEDINLLAMVATYEAHQRTVRALDAAAADMGPLLYRRFRPVPRTIALRPSVPALRFWPWPSTDATLPVPKSPETLQFDPAVLEAVQEWEVEQQRREAESALRQATSAVIAEEPIPMGPEVPTMYHLAIPVIPPPPSAPSAAVAEPEPEPEPEPEVATPEADAEADADLNRTMRFAVPVVPPPPPQPEVAAAESAVVEEVVVEEVVVEEVVVEEVVVEEDEPITLAITPEVLPASTALILVREPGGHDEPEETTDLGYAVLTPIIETPVPPMAKQVKLPWYGLSPVIVPAGPRDLNIPPVFVIADAYIPPRSVKASRPIPSPLLHSRNAAVSRPPSWLVTAAVAMLIPITAIGIVNYWILPAQRASAASEVVETAAPATQQESPAAANWRKQLQLTGIRMQDSKVRFVLINHAKTDAPAMSLLVHLRAVNAKAADPAIASFQIRLSPLAPGEARDLSSSIELIPPARNVDWTDIRAEIQLAKLL